MPTIDLSTLDGPELRRLLDSARRQGQAAQSYEILREMEARRQRGPRPRTLSVKRPARQPRTISLEFRDPLDMTQDPLLDETTEDLPPLTLDEAPTREPPPEPPPKAPKAHGWAHWGALIFALGLAGGVAAGWWASDFANGGAPRSAASPAQAAAPATAAVQTAALAPAVPPANAEAPVSLVPDAGQTPAPPPPPAATESTATPAPAPAPAVATAAADPAPAAPVTATPAETVPLQPVPAPLPVKLAEPATESACGAHPADRTICADAKLRRLQGELRDAYAEALKAHEDKGLLRQRELAWAEARNDVTDPGELARLYRERIEKLRAATADALKQRRQSAPAAD